VAIVGNILDLQRRKNDSYASQSCVHDTVGFVVPVTVCGSRVPNNSCGPSFIPYSDVPCHFCIRRVQFGGDFERASLVFTSISVSRACADDKKMKESMSCLCFHHWKKRHAALIYACIGIPPHGKIAGMGHAVI
jgi:hypothetical protein